MEDAGVEVRFPGHPEAKNTTEDGVSVRVYSLFPKPGQGFVFAVSKYPNTFTSKTAEAELEMNVANFCKSANQKLQSKTKLSHQDPFVIEAITDGGGFKSWSRYFVHGNLVYGLVAIYRNVDPAEPVPFDDMVTFLHSITILQATPKN